MVKTWKTFFNDWNGGGKKVAPLIVCTPLKNWNVAPKTNRIKHRGWKNVSMDQRKLMDQLVRKTVDTYYGHRNSLKARIPNYPN